MSLLGRPLQLVSRAFDRMFRFFRAYLQSIQAKRERRRSRENPKATSTTASKATQTTPEARSPMTICGEPRPQWVTSLPISMKRRPAFCRGVPNLKSIDNVLPSELLTLICEYLPTPDLYSFREVSRRCSNAAHTLFCRTIDQRSFPITCKELKKLDRMVQSTECGGYMTTLRIDTQVACECQRFGYASWTGWKRPGSLSSAVFGCFPRGRHDSSGCSRALKRVLRRMPNVETIELASFGVRISQAAVAVGGFIEPPVPGPVPPCSTVERWATWRALNLLVQAFDVNTLQGNTLPYPTKLALNGPFPIEALPGNTILTSTSCLFDHLTALNLTIADTEMDPLNLRILQPDRYLPDFLRILPPTLKDLAIAFPKDTYNERMFSQGPRPVPALFEDFGFEALLTPDDPISFPHLAKLHFTNLSLGDYHHLTRFLQPHASTLRTLQLTDLALTGADWRPFIISLKENLELERFELDSQLTEREKEVDLLIWQSTPPELRLRRVDYEGLSRETTVNGVKVEQMAGAGALKEGGSGCEGDEEDGGEGESWAA